MENVLSFYVADWGTNEPPAGFTNQQPWLPSTVKYVFKPELAELWHRMTVQDIVAEQEVDEVRLYVQSMVINGLLLDILYSGTVSWSDMDGAVVTFGKEGVDPRYTSIALKNGQTHSILMRN